MSVHSTQIKICDVGCGKGRYLKNLSEDLTNADLYAVDISSRVMENISFVSEKKQRMLTHIPYNNMTFDVVYAVEALSHAIDVNSAIDEMLRITRKDGRVIILDKSIRAMGKLEICAWEKWFDDNEMKLIAKRTGCYLEIVEDIAYENNLKDGLFNAWIFYKN